MKVIVLNNQYFNSSDLISSLQEIEMLILHIELSSIDQVF